MMTHFNESLAFLSHITGSEIRERLIGIFSVLQGPPVCGKAVWRILLFCNIRFVSWYILFPSTYSSFYHGILESEAELCGWAFIMTVFPHIPSASSLRFSTCLSRMHSKLIIVQLLCVLFFPFRMRNSILKILF